MKRLKKTNIEQEGFNCSPVPIHKCPPQGPFFNPDYFAHVVVQTLEELESIPCKLRQDGMVATVVQEDYSDYQLQTSRTGFGVCDNNAWVKISTGSEVFSGGNLLLFQTEEQANKFINSTQSKKGQIIYISDLDSYFKSDGSQITNTIVDYNSRKINTENGLEGGGKLDKDLYIGIDLETRTNIDKGVEGYEISTKIGDPDSLIPDWSNDIITKTNF